MYHTVTSVFALKGSRSLSSLRSALNGTSAARRTRSMDGATGREGDHRRLHGIGLYEQETSGVAPGSMSSWVERVRSLPGSLRVDAR